MSGEVVFFSVVLGAGAMGMGSQVVVLGSDLLRFVHTHSHCTCRAVLGADTDKGLATKGACESCGQKCRICLEHAGFAA